MQTALSSVDCEHARPRCLRCAQLYVTNRLERCSGAMQATSREPLNSCFLNMYPHHQKQAPRGPFLRCLPTGTLTWCHEVPTPLVTCLIHSFKDLFERHIFPRCMYEGTGYHGRAGVPGSCKQLSVAAEGLNPASGGELVCF